MSSWMCIWVQKDSVNPPAGPKPQKMQMKCFLVQAQFPEGQEYEALARQMLEQIDYEGLAKLIEP